MREMLAGALINNPVADPTHQRSAAAIGGLIGQATAFYAGDPGQLYHLKPQYETKKNNTVASAFKQNRISWTHPITSPDSTINSQHRIRTKIIARTTHTIIKYRCARVPGVHTAHPSN